MKEETANKIYNEIVEEWAKLHDKKKLDPMKLAKIKQAILSCPYEDGNQRVSRLGKTETYLVPIKHILLHGLYYDELDKFEKETKGDQNR